MPSKYVNLLIRLYWLIVVCMSSRQGNTPLIMATRKGMVDIVRLLLDRGADISMKDKVRLEL